MSAVSHMHYLIDYT